MEDGSTDSMSDDEAGRRNKRDRDNSVSSQEMDLNGEGRRNKLGRAGTNSLSPQKDHHDRRSSSRRGRDSTDSSQVQGDNDDLHRDKRGRMLGNSSRERGSDDERSSVASSVSDATDSRARSVDSLVNQFYPRDGRRDNGHDSPSGSAPALPEFLEEDHATVPPVLSNEGVTRFFFPTSIIEDEQGIIKAADERIGTIDSVSKSFKMSSPKDEEHFVQPIDGQPLCFVAPCSANLPRHIQDVLYFFHRLEGCIKSHSLNHYVVPTRATRLEKLRDRPKDVRELRQPFRPRNRTTVAEETRESGPAFSMAKSYHKSCPSGAEREITVNLQFLKIHVGFTGAVFDSDGDVKQEVFCVVTVRPARSFDVAAFIHEVFLSTRKGNTTTEASNDLTRLRGIWTSVLQFEANMNLGLEEDPMKQQCSPYAPMGMFCLLNLLNVPLRIHHVVQSRNPGASGVRIIGFPALSFADDEEMMNYVEYVREYALHGEQSLHELRLAIQTYYSTKDGQQGGLEYDIKCPGGWPSRMSRSSAHGSDEVFKGWSVWRLPLIMLFETPPLIDNMDYDTFSANIGGLPPLAVKKILDMKQADFSDPQNTGCIADELVLEGSGKALPYLQSKKYFGESADLMKELRVNGCMIERWKAVNRDIRERLLGGATTPRFVVTLLKRHMYSCMEYHSAKMEAGEYNSQHLEECHTVGARISKTLNEGVKLGDYLRELRKTKVDFRIRHDAYLSTSSLLFLMLTDLNDDFSLNAVNLYAYFEMLISSIVFVVGGHDPTIHTFFGALEICGAQGHMEVLDERQRPCMDTRKPNTTGAGILLVCLNHLADLVAEGVGIDLITNYLRTLMQVRWSAVAMETQTMCTFVNGVMTSKPSNKFMDCPVASLEGRGDTDTRDASLITNGIQRDDNVNTNVTTTSVDPEKTGVRKMQEKFQYTYPVLVGLASNCPPTNPDPGQTIAAVIHVIASGAPAYLPKKDVDDRKANDITSDSNAKRVTKPQDKPRKSILAMFFSLLFWAKADVAVLHRSAMLPAQNTPQSMAMLDWMFLYIKEHLIGLFDERVAQSFTRMTQGYETRHLAGALWVQSIKAFMRSEQDLKKAALDAALGFALDPIPISETAAVGHSLLSRGLHVGLFSAVSCLIQALKVPIVPLRHLRCFFAADEGSPDPGEDKSEPFLVVPCVDSAEPVEHRAPQRDARKAGGKTERWADVAEQGSAQKDLYFAMRQLEDMVGRFHLILTHSQSRVDGELQSLRQGLDRLCLGLAKQEVTTEDLVHSKHVVFDEMGQERMYLKLKAEKDRMDLKRVVAERVRLSTGATQEGGEGNGWQQQKQRGGRRRKGGGAH